MRRQGTLDQLKDPFLFDPPLLLAAEILIKRELHTDRRAGPIRRVMKLQKFQLF